MSTCSSINVPPVQTERLVIRPLRASDRAAFVELMEASEDFLRPWSPRRPEGQTLDEFWAQQLARAEEGLAQGSMFRGVGVLLKTGELAGCFNLNNITRGVFQNADAGWMMHARHAGRGLATEGVRAILDIAFAPPPLGLGLHRVQANVIPSNLASLRVCEKAGFRREGLGLEMLEIDGRWQDHVMHAKLEREHVMTYIGSR